MGFCPHHQFPSYSHSHAPPLINNCRFLEESNCVGMCLNLCKNPCQKFIKDSLGMPVNMVPSKCPKSGRIQWSMLIFRHIISGIQIQSNTHYWNKQSEKVKQIIMVRESNSTCTRIWKTRSSSKWRTPWMNHLGHNIASRWIKSRVIIAACGII